MRLRNGQLSPRYALSMTGGTISFANMIHTSERPIRTSSRRMWPAVIKRLLLRFTSLSPQDFDSVPRIRRIFGFIVVQTRPLSIMAQALERLVLSTVRCVCVAQMQKPGGRRHDRSRKDDVALSPLTLWSVPL